MKKLLLISLFLPFLAFAEAPSLSITPETVIQGEPIMVQADGPVSKMTFDGKKLDVFTYNGKPTALIGIDLNKKAGTYKLSVTSADGTVTRDVVVGARVKEEKPVGIPEKLGGNTPAAGQALVSSLAKENAVLNSLKSFAKPLWKEKFRYPLDAVTVTDTYGYTRDTAGLTIAHKGTDFRAKEGTPVYSMNRGIVRYARTTRTYGKTVVVDHGFGLMSMYMHLSKIRVNEGELVQKGQLVANSGMTGYAESPHLHLSVRIGSISIDPLKFMALLGPSI
ncbi:M23 family metallopeptidase [Candidatus Parcubacteria bacterium]|nr:M23 family metallopeptidase [Candidatus Parcubacteria bacterium]